MNRQTEGWGEGTGLEIGALHLQTMTMLGNRNDGPHYVSAALENLAILSVEVFTTVDYHGDTEKAHLH